MPVADGLGLVPATVSSVAQEASVDSAAVGQVPEQIYIRDVCQTVPYQSHYACDELDDNRSVKLERKCSWSNMRAKPVPPRKK